MSSPKRHYPGLEEQLGISGSLLQVHPGAHVAVVLQSLRAGWSSCKSGDCLEPTSSGRWALEFHRGVQDELAELGCGDHCLTIVSGDDGHVCASTMYQPARPSARLAYSCSHCPLSIRDEEVVSDVTGRWCTSMFSVAARKGFIDRLHNLGAAGAEEIIRLISEAGSFGAGLERHQILSELWCEDQEKLRLLSQERSWHLDNLAWLEHQGHELWLPNQDRLRSRQPSQAAWLSTKVFRATHNPRSWDPS